MKGEGKITNEHIHIKFKIQTVLTLAITILIVAILLYPHFPPDSGRKGHTYTMDFVELGEDWNNLTTGFDTLREGDKIMIEDTINELYVVSGQTYIFFKGAFIIIDGNVSNEFQVGDKVVITLTVKDYEDVQYGYRFHWFEEDLDGARGNLVLPRSVLKHRI